MKEFQIAEWAYDRFAKECDRCDRVIGRYGVIRDSRGIRHVLWWPHRAWDGVEGTFRCRAHSVPLQEWRKLLG